MWKNSGTTSNVSIVMHGSDATSAPIVIHQNTDKKRRMLARGSTDKFYVNLAQCLGSIKQLQIWHDNSGPHPSWFLDSIIVKDVQEDQTTQFICNRWFALEREDGKIARSIYSTSEEELRSFKSNFKSGISKSYADGHLWLSVITKTPKSTFTRVERTTCCLTLLFSAMIANAMFYRLDEVPDPTFQVGPLKFSARQVAVGFQSCLIVAPINLLIVWLFRNSLPQTLEEKKDKRGMESNIDIVETGTLDLTIMFKATDDTVCIDKEQDSKQYFERRPTVQCNGKWVTDIDALNLHVHDSVLEPITDEVEYDRSITGFMLPAWCRWIAWFLCFAIVVISASFTFFYSLMWGKEIANQWLSSMFVSFVQDVLLNQPIKMLAAMVVLACMFKRSSRKIGTGFIKTGK